MKTILVLGAYSDIGKAIAKKFASEKYNLILAGRNKQKLMRLKQEIVIKFSVDVGIAEFDACNYASHVDFYTHLEVKPDVTICVFGYLGDQKTAQQNWEEAHEILAVNYIGAVSLLNIIATDYEKKGNGCIIGISSVAGERGRQSNYLYGSAKGGFSIYLEGLRNRLYKSNIHVLTIKPGFVDTAMTEGLDLPKALTASPDQVGNAVYRGFLKKKNTLYILSIWQYIMFIIKIIPEYFFKKLNL